MGARNQSAEDGVKIFGSGAKQFGNRRPLFGNGGKMYGERENGSAFGRQFGQEKPFQNIHSKEEVSQMDFLCYATML